MKYLKELSCVKVFLLIFSAVLILILFILEKCDIQINPNIVNACIYFSVFIVFNIFFDVLCDYIDITIYNFKNIRKRKRK